MKGRMLHFKYLGGRTKIVGADAEKMEKGGNIVMRMLWKLTKEAARYKVLYVVAIVSTLCLTGVNLAAPKVLSAMTGVVERAQALAATKLGDSLLSVLVLAIFCNILIYIAVEGYRSIPHELGKYLAVFFGVTVFVVCGFEHCIANMYYFTAAGAWFGSGAGMTNPFVFILVNTLGNVVGGLLIPAVTRLSGHCARLAGREESVR